MKSRKWETIAGILFMFLFLATSIIFIEGPIERKSEQAHSSSLTIKKEISPNQERTAFQDANGKITCTADVGYAIKTITSTPTGELEEFFDERGIPLAKSSGYYAIFTELDDQGNKKQTTYLDADGQPTQTDYGYAIVVYSYDPSSRICIEKYYDQDMRPVCSEKYGYGKKSEFENGKAIRIAFLDDTEKPMKTSLGYAQIMRTYYSSEDVENGKVKEEYYFDEWGEPIALNIGCYGVYQGYNERGQNSIITYLNADGQPLIINKGYSTVVRTFNNDSSLATERYYIDGMPVCRSEGQYGIKYEGGQEIFLNADGSEQFNLKKLLYNHSYYAIVYSLVIVLLSAFSNRKINFILLFLHMGVVLYFTLLFRDSKNIYMALDLFHSYGRILIDPESRTGIIRNIWLFIPLGAILNRLYPKMRILLVAFAFSILIEMIQLFLRTGYCELDDVISNSLGSLIGYMMGILSFNARQHFSRSNVCIGATSNS